MKKQTKERGDLTWEVPPGDPIPIHVELFNINDVVPEDDAIREVVAGLRNGRVIKAEHINVWLRGI